ncbi:MAG: cobalamin B12-binding domain-containing protein [Chloroflexi bacterium]|nr:cobalamin B12-binding domain-containing protein [Chloroflexota bacterium]
MANKQVRILLSKIGLDGHNRGILLVARMLRDAGFEVVYLGWHRTPEEVVQAAIQEDVDLIGLNSMADAHRVLAPKVVALLREKGARTPVVLGGFIQPEDIPELKANGIAEVFPSGTDFDRAIEWIHRNVAEDAA